MRLQNAILAAGLAGIAFTAGTFATPASQEDARNQEEMPSMDEMMAAYMAAGETNEHHEGLKQFVGTWDATSKFWSVPGEPPMESTGVMVGKAIFGGRFVEQSFESNIMGQEFVGRGLWGYSNTDECYKSIWIDNMVTDLGFSTGYLSEDGKIYTLMGSQTSPMDGSREAYEDICAIRSDDQHSFTRFMIMPDGSKMKSMEIVYNRRTK